MTIEQATLLDFDALVQKLDGHIRSKEYSKNSHHIAGTNSTFLAVVLPNMKHELRELYTGNPSLVIEDSISMFPLRTIHRKHMSITAYLEEAHILRTMESDPNEENRMCTYYFYPLEENYLYDLHINVKEISPH